MSKFNETGIYGDEIDLKNDVTYRMAVNDCIMKSKQFFKDCIDRLPDNSMRDIESGIFVEISYHLVSKLEELING